MHVVPMQALRKTGTITNYSYARKPRTLFAGRTRSVSTFRSTENSSAVTLCAT